MNTTTVLKRRQSTIGFRPKAMVFSSGGMSFIGLFGSSSNPHDFLTTQLSREEVIKFLSNLDSSIARNALFGGEHILVPVGEGRTLSFFKEHKNQVLGAIHEALLLLKRCNRELYRSLVEDIRSRKHLTPQ